MKSIMEIMQSVGLVPVIKVDKAEDAVPLCQALLEGGLPIAEITFRTEAAAQAIRLVRAALPEMLTGAGTVTSLALAQTALEAGAQFVVTPGFNPQVVSFCQEKGLPVLPGCTTASEVESAQNLGLGVVKFFPAEQSGGLVKIKALGGPYPAMRFIPTGGIGSGNILEYLAYDKILACGGSFMVSPALVNNKDWQGIRAETRAALAQIAGLSLERVELPATGKAAQELGARCAALLGAGSRGLAVGKGPQPCLVFSALSLERACRLLQQSGFGAETRVVAQDAKGQALRVALASLPGGFAVDLVKKQA